VEQGLYAILAVFVTDQFIGWVVEGPSYARAVWVVSEKGEEIEKTLWQELGRGVTAFSETGNRREAYYLHDSNHDMIASASSEVVNISMASQLRSASSEVVSTRQVSSEVVSTWQASSELASSQRWTTA
jgi:hypothetical protein